jgi:hypothetical protein
LVGAGVLVATSTAVFADLSSESFGSWYLDQSNTFGDGTIFGQVDILADTDDGTVEFTVTPRDVQPLYGTLNNFGVQKFGFNYINVSSDPSTWGLELPSVDWSLGDGRMDGFGVYLATPEGDGDSRQDPLWFRITLPDIDEAVADNFAALPSGTAGEGDFFFSAHVAGIAAAGGVGSHFVAGSREVPIVPAPGAILLAVLGLGTLVGLGRRLTSWRT